MYVSMAARFNDFRPTAAASWIVTIAPAVKYRKDYRG
jgi:hypothetical protein